MTLLTIHSKQKGLSLIELMIAMALSLTLMAGVLQIFVSNKKSFEITRDLSDVQENGRLGLTFVGESIRMADHWAGIEGEDVDAGGITVSDIGACTSARILDTSVAIEGFEGGASAPVPCIQNEAENYREGTDVIVVRYADARQQLTDAQAAALDGADENVYVRVNTAQDARLFDGSTQSTARTDIPLADGVYNFAYMTELYYVRNCSILGADSKCDENVDDIPTLVRMALVGDSFTEQPLVEGIEQIQYEYGIDTDNDQVADTYFTAGDTELNSDEEWDTVMSVRMSVVSRATQIDIALNDTNAYTMVDGEPHTALADERQYRRKQFNREIHLRNRSRL